MFMVVIAVVVVLVVALLKHASAVGGREGFCARWNLQPDAKSAEYIDDYLRRARLRSKFGGGAAIIALVFPILFMGQLLISSTTLFLALSFYLVGTIVAEWRDLKPKNRGAVSASLEVRSVALFSTSDLDQYIRVVTGLTIVAALVQGVMGGMPGRVWSVVVATVALLALLLIELTQRAIASRARPVDHDLHAADTAIRTAGIESVRALGLSLAVLILGMEAVIIGVDLIRDNAGFVLLAIGLVILSALLSLGARWPFTAPAQPQRQVAK